MMLLAMANEVHHSDCDDIEPPQTKWDLALAALAMAASVPMVAANVVVFLHRRSRCIKAKGGATLTVTSSAAGLAWISSSFIVNFHLRRDNPFLLRCPFWTFWIFLSFGFCLWLSCLLLRLYRLTAPPRSPASTLVGMFVFWFPSCLFAVIATAASASTPVDRNSCAIATCLIKSPTWKYCTFFILPLFYLLVLLLFLFRCKNSNDCTVTNEYSHTADYSFMAFVIYLLYGVDILTGSYKKISGRCFLTFCICCMVFSEFWVRMGSVVYHLCTSKGASEMDPLPDDLMASPSQDHDWILTAINNARQNITEYQETIDQLKQKKETLRDKIVHLQKTTIMP